MAGLFDPTTRPERQHTADVARLEAFRRDEAVLIARRPNASEFDALIAYEEELAALRRKISVAEEVAAHSAALVEKALAERAEREADAAHAAEEKAAKADEKLARTVDDLVRKLATARDELAASVARTATYNKNSGRAPIADAEQRVRQQSPRTIPAVFEDREIWRNAAGETPGAWVEGPEGEMVPAGHHNFTRRSEKVQVRAEQFVPARMPARYAEALKLVDREGRAL